MSFKFPVDKLLDNKKDQKIASYTAISKGNQGNDPSYAPGTKYPD
jgi:hypothetical protein